MQRFGVILSFFVTLFAVLECKKLGKNSDMTGGSKFASIQYVKSNQTFRIQDGFLPNSVAWANFTDLIETTGWSYLTVTTNESYSDSVQSYAAGLVEGYITANHIYMAWMNTIGKYCQDKSPFCMRLQAYLQINLNWIVDHISNNASDPYFHQIQLLLQQLNGLQDGYSNAPVKPSLHVDDVFGFLLFQISGDLEDLESALNKPNLKRTVGSGSCSALVKLLPQNADLYVAHDTWSGFQSMLRIMKKYEFKFHMTENSNVKIPGHTASFSSSPGSLLSGDDFYILSSGLVTQETTIGNSNPDLWKHVKPEGAVLEWMRNVVANRLATTTMEWTDIFTKYNSGTYNNQWMVVDYKKFTPGKELPETGVLAILEQLPGSIVAKDMTQLLTKQMYWSSYNIPYFPDIFNQNGSPDMVAKYGDFFTYDKSPRALIFKRDQVKVKDVKSMMKLMRYNDFKNDPLSHCNCTPPYSGENAISARSDLNPANGTYPFGAVGHRCHGGTDMKMTTSSMYKTFSMMAVSGPTHDQQPPFQWSKSDYKDLSHFGHPDLWNFGPVQVTWTQG